MAENKDNGAWSARAPSYPERWLFGALLSRGTAYISPFCGSGFAWWRGVFFLGLDARKCTKSGKAHPANLLQIV